MMSLRIKIKIQSGSLQEEIRDGYLVTEKSEKVWASEPYLATDKEMQRAFETCNVKAVRLDYELALEYYEVFVSADLTQEIRFIEAFKPIVAPYTNVRMDYGG